MKFPENFDSQARGEAALRQRSRAIIEASDDLLLHAHMIETSLTVLDQVAKYGRDDTEDGRTIRRLFLRCFNSSAGAMQMLMTGYYQNAVMLMRDILETTFLVDYLQHIPSEIAVWRECSERKRKKLFNAAHIRKTLDDRDGYTSRKREDAYQLLCQLGSHPTYPGFRMTMPTGSDEAVVGPFVDEKALDAILSELAKTIMQSGAQATAARDRTLIDMKTSLAFFQMQADWGERFWGVNSVDRVQIFNMAMIVAEIERRGGIPPK